MGATQRRTVRLVGGPADGHDVPVVHAWAFVAVLAGEVLVFNSDAGPGEAIQMLERVPHGGWTQYVQVEEHPEIYRAEVGSTPRLETPAEDTGLPLWYRPRWSAAGP